MVENGIITKDIIEKMKSKKLNAVTIDKPVSDECLAEFERRTEYRKKVCTLYEEDVVLLSQLYIY